MSVLQVAMLAASTRQVPAMLVWKGMHAQHGFALVYFSMAAAYCLELCS